MIHLGFNFVEISYMLTEKPQSDDYTCVWYTQYTHLAFTVFVIPLNRQPFIGEGFTFM